MGEKVDWDSPSFSSTPLVRAFVFLGIFYFIGTNCSLFGPCLAFLLVILPCLRLSPNLDRRCWAFWHGSGTVHGTNQRQVTANPPLESLIYALPRTQMDSSCVAQHSTSHPSIPPDPSQPWVGRLAFRADSKAVPLTPIHPLFASRRLWCASATWSQKQQRRQPNLNPVRNTPPQRLANPDHRLWIRHSIEVALAILPLHRFCTLPALARQPRMLPAISHRPHRFPAAQCSAQQTTGLAICDLNLPSDSGLLFWRSDSSHCHTFDGSPPRLVQERL